MTVILGIDTGGTFTDFVLLETGKGVIATTKVSSTPTDPARAIANGLGQLPGLKRLDRIVIGTTVATNAVLERRGPRLIYITNEGFEDVPFIGRMDKERIYDLNWMKPKPLMRRRDSLGVAGRIDAKAQELQPVSDSSLADLIARLPRPDATQETFAVAICCLFSYLDGAHEIRIADAVARALPGTEISLSHQVSPLWREYERASTTLADAFIKQIVGTYVERVGSAINDHLPGMAWTLLASNGGYISAGQARKHPAQLLISGLAGGIIGGRHIAELATIADTFTLDIGGTSTDIGIIIDGMQQYATEFQIDFGIPVTLPSVAVRTIGAGGGSIAWLDKAGMLHVGPQSAGSEPGPAGYGRGGQDATVTDANLVLGRLDPERFLGGAMRIDIKAAHAAVSRVAQALNRSVEAAALAIIQTVDENMANAIRLIAVEKGLDPRIFALNAFGGAGPVHARSVAERLGIEKVIVPPHPGLCSALGAAIADARIDRMQTIYAHSDALDLGVVARKLEDLARQSITDLRQSIEVTDPVLLCSADMRYAGQNYEIEVPLSTATLTVELWQDAMAAFATEHSRLYGFDLPGEPIELITLRATALASEPAFSYADVAAAVLPAPSYRPVWFNATGSISTAIYQRSDLTPGVTLKGPAIIEQADSTTIINPGDTVTVVAGGILILTLEKVKQ